MRSTTHRRIPTVRLLILGVAAALLAVACGGSDDESTPAAPPEPPRDGETLSAAEILKILMEAPE